MARTETELMEGWEFARENCAEEAFSDVGLPHDWAVAQPFDKDMEEGASQGFRSRSGIGWYSRRLIINNKREDACYYLEFGGIYENSTIWVNGKEAGGHKYGYSSFRLDVTPFLVEGENMILVKVDNTQRPSDRWYSGAGIYRTVKLVEVDRVHFDMQEVVVSTQISGSTARLSVKTGLSGKRVCAELYEKTEALSPGRRTKTVRLS